MDSGAGGLDVGCLTEHFEMGGIGELAAEEWREEDGRGSRLKLEILKMEESVARSKRS